MTKLTITQRKEKRLALIKELKYKKMMATKPILPSKFTARANGNEIEISWNESKANFDAIKIEASPDGDNWNYPYNPIHFDPRSDRSGRVKIIHHAGYNTKCFFRLQVLKHTWSGYLQADQETGPQPQHENKKETLL